VLTAGTIRFVGGVMEFKPKEKGMFIRVKCKDCSNEQITFNKPSQVVNCRSCGSTLIKPAGGKGRLVNGEITGVLQ